MENFIIMRVQRKIRFLGRFTKNQYIGGGGGGGGGGLAIKGAWTTWKFKRGLGKKERGGVFEQC